MIIFQYLYRTYIVDFTIWVQNFEIVFTRVSQKKTHFKIMYKSNVFDSKIILFFANLNWKWSVLSSSSALSYIFCIHINDLDSISHMMYCTECEWVYNFFFTLMNNLITNCLIVNAYRYVFHENNYEFSVVIKRIQYYGAVLYII